MELVFKKDGSIETLGIDAYVVKGNDNVNEVFVAVRDRAVSDYFMTAYFTLPNGDVNSLTGVVDEKEIGGIHYHGYKILLTAAQTLYAGDLKMSIQLVKTGSTEILYTYNYTFKVNDSPYDPTTDEEKINGAQYHALVSSLTSYLLKQDIHNLKAYQTRDDAIDDFSNIVENGYYCYLDGLKLVFGKKYNGQLNDLPKYLIVGEGGGGGGGTGSGIWGEITGDINSQLDLIQALSNKQDVLTEEQEAAVDSGINAEKVEELDANTNARHTHSNKSTLDSIDSAQRLVSPTDRTTWNGKQNALSTVNKLPYTYISGTPDIFLKEDKSNKVTTFSDSSTDTQYPSAKAVRDFVNSSIQASAANYLTYNAAGDAFPTRSDLRAATGYYSGGVLVSPSKNDYCIVIRDEDHDDASTRYIFSQAEGSLGQWEYQYTISATSFTAAQLAAINSGIDDTKVGLYDTHIADTDIHVTTEEKELYSNPYSAGDGIIIEDSEVAFNFSGSYTWNSSQVYKGTLRFEPSGQSMAVIDPAIVGDDFSISSDTNDVVIKAGTGKNDYFVANGRWFKLANGITTNTKSTAYTLATTADVDKKQNKLTAGYGISILSDGTIRWTAPADYVTVGNEEQIATGKKTFDKLYATVNAGQVNEVYKSASYINVSRDGNIITVSGMRVGGADGIQIVGTGLYHGTLEIIEATSESFSLESNGLQGGRIQGLNTPVTIIKNTLTLFYDGAGSYAFKLKVTPVAGETVKVADYLKKYYKHIIKIDLTDDLSFCKVYEFIDHNENEYSLADFVVLMQRDMPTPYHPTIRVPYDADYPEVEEAVIIFPNNHEFTVDLISTNLTNGTLTNNGHRTMDERQFIDVVQEL